MPKLAAILFSFVCVWYWSRLLGAQAPPPISLNLPSKFSLHHAMYLSRWSISRGPPSPHFFKPNKNTDFKSRLCLKRLPHIFTIRCIVGFNFKNWLTKNYVNVVFKNDYLSSAIFWQCCELKFIKKNISKVIVINKQYLFNWIFAIV